MDGLFEQFDTGMMIGDAEKSMSRKSHPPTSKEAAKHLVESGELATRQAEAMETLRMMPGLTAAELEQMAGVKCDGVIRKRLAELRKQGLARNGEDRPCRVTGEKAQTWYAVERRREQQEPYQAGQGSSPGLKEGLFGESDHE